MKTKILSLLAAAMVFASCVSEFAASTNQQENNEIEIILPEKDYDIEGFINALKSIEVINLQADSNSMYNEEADLRVSSNYYYFISRGLHLMCYEKATGKLLCSKNIMGRSRAECTFMSSAFVLGDSLVVNDVGVLKMYDHNGKFCGILGEPKSSNVLPLGDGYVCCDKAGNYYDQNRCITVLDSNFSEMGSYFKIPKGYKRLGSFRVANTSPDTYIFNDTLRFAYPYTFQLHSFPVNKTYHFIPSKPAPESEIKKVERGDFADFIRKMEFEGYACEFRDLVENEDFILFKYRMASKPYDVLYSKPDNKVYVFGGYIDYKTSADMWKSIIGLSEFLYSDGKYFYARAFREAYNILESHKDLLDDRQRTIYDTMKARLAQSDEKDFRFYYKFEF